MPGKLTDHNLLTDTWNIRGFGRVYESWEENAGAAKGSLELAYSHEFTTNPPYAGDPSANTELSRAVVKRFFEDVLTGHDLDALAEIASPDILIHPTAMPYEASFYGINDAGGWLGRQWKTFPDLTIAVDFTVAQGDVVAVHWTARGTSKGNLLMLPPTGEVSSTQARQCTGLRTARSQKSGRRATRWASCAS